MKKQNRGKEQIKINGVKINFVPLKKVLKQVSTWSKYNKKHHITTPNPEQIIIAQEDREFKRIINDSDLSIPDGIGLVLTARLKNGLFNPLYKRLSGVDLMLALCDLAEKENLKVFLLGGKNNVVQKAKKQLELSNKDLQVGYFNGAEEIKKETKKEKAITIRKINEFKPDFLFVAYGAPFQEKWIADNLKDLNVKIAMGVGGAFDYIAGNIKRAPVWVRRIGMEWLWRLFLQPWRWKRQLRLISFVKLFFLDSQ